MYDLSKAEFFFCETLFASGTSPWHIRPRGEKGLMLGGGADTLALCGRNVAWDLNVPITPNRVAMNACQKCAALFAEIKPEER